MRGAFQGYLFGGFSRIAIQLPYIAIPFGLGTYKSNPSSLSQFLHPILPSSLNLFNLFNLSNCFSPRPSVSPSPGVEPLLPLLRLAPNTGPSRDVVDRTSASLHLPPPRPIRGLFKAVHLQEKKIYETKRARRSLGSSTRSERVDGRDTWPHPNKSQDNWS